MGKYSCFEHLSANESRGADYEVSLRHGSSGIAVVSIHGGAIEPGTSEVAEAVAGADHSFYTFRGVKKAGNKGLHITSTLFDEPDALEIVLRSETIVSIHGCSEAEEVVHVGGIDFRLRECIEERLREAGFKALNNKSASLRGQDRRNICNRCRRGMGVQLEISK
ncbi:MAG: poly-gamma-glutamate hydrolase family protein, partial [Syntrophobacteraceae bacterium]